MTNKPLPSEIKPITTRQIAIALLLILLFVGGSGYCLYQRKARLALSYAPLIIPKVITHKVVSATKDSYFESMSFAIPANLKVPVAGH